MKTTLKLIGLFMAAVFMFHSCSDMLELEEEPQSEAFKMYKEMLARIEDSKEAPALFDKLAHSFVKGNGEQLFTQEWLDEFIAATGITIDYSVDALNEIAQTLMENATSEEAMLNLMYEGLSDAGVEVFNNIYTQTITNLNTITGFNSLPSNERECLLFMNEVKNDDSPPIFLEGNLNSKFLVFWLVVGVGALLERELFDGHGFIGGMVAATVFVLSFLVK